jgi:type I restriction enzyme S subunit
MKEGWKYKKIGELFQTYAGGTPLKQHKEYYQGGDIPWLRSGEVCQKYITRTEMFITQKGLENSSARYFPKDTVVIAMYGATAAQVGILKIKTTSNQAVCGILPNDNYSPEFIYYWFTYNKGNLASQAQGGAQPNISQIKIKNVLIPLLPLSEQQRIVSYLDSAFAKIDAVAKNAEDSLNEAKALFQSALAKMMEPKEGWEEKYLDELAENLDYKRIPVTLNKRKSGKYPYYGASGIVDYVEDYIFDGNYLLISEDGANLLARATPIAFPVTGKFWVNNHAHILEFKDSITQLFVEFYFKLIDIKEYVTGAAQPKLTQRNMNKIPIFIPSLDKQKIVVCALQNIESKVQQLQSNLTRTLSECAALKQSILRQTFE